MAGFSTYLEDAVMTHVFSNGGAAYVQPAGGLTVSLHTGDPGETDAAALANEVSGAGYSRKAITFTAPNDGVVSNLALIEWTNMPEVTVTHAAVWDEGLNHMLASGALSPARTIPAGDSFQMQIGQFVITLS